MHYNTEWCITKMQNMGKYLSTHISGRATVAVDTYVFRRVYVKLQMYRYYSK